MLTQFSLSRYINESTWVWRSFFAISPPTFFSQLFEKCSIYVDMRAHRAFQTLLQYLIANSFSSCFAFSSMPEASPLRWLLLLTWLARSLSIRHTHICFGVISYFVLVFVLVSVANVIVIIVLRIAMRHS